MRAVVVDKFGHGDMVHPCFRVGTTEDVEVGFDLLVEPFHFSVGLGMVQWLKKLSQCLAIL